MAEKPVFFYIPMFHLRQTNKAAQAPLLVTLTLSAKAEEDDQMGSTALL